LNTSKALIHVAQRAAVLSVVCAAALAFGGCSGPRLDPNVPRHVVVISIDTARADHFGFMGSDTVKTPRLDALAAESIVFTDYMTVVPTTLASHTTLFTGRYPMHHGVARNGFVVNESNEMLAETLKAAGFHTAGFAGSFALDERFGFAQGFDHYDQDFSIFVGDGGADQNQRRAEHVTDAAVAYLDGHGIPGRLFLFVHYFDPHGPYAAPSPWNRMYDPLGGNGLYPADVVKSSRAFTTERVEENARRVGLQYASEISYADEHVGRLLDYLKERGVLDDALVVLTTDHGECMWEHGEEFGHGRTVYQATVHALCTFRLPGGEAAGTRVDQLLANIDVLPTLLGVLKLEAPDGIDGEKVDLRDLETGIDLRVRFGEATKPHRNVETDPRWANALKARCIRVGRYKYVWTPYAHTRELYDLNVDRDETNNLLVQPDEETARLAADFHTRLVEWTESADPLTSTFDPSQREESIRRLRSLGYLQ